MEVVARGRKGVAVVECLDAHVALLEHHLSGKPAVPGVTAGQRVEINVVIDSRLGVTFVSEELRRHMKVNEGGT